MFDLSGARGWDIFVVRARGCCCSSSPRSSRVTATGDSRLPSSVPASSWRSCPSGLLSGATWLWHMFETLDDHLEAANKQFPRSSWAPPTRASESFSWFGPVGLVLLVAAGAPVSCWPDVGRCPASLCCSASPPYVVDHRRGEPAVPPVLRSVLRLSGGSLRNSLGPRPPRPRMGVGDLRSRGDDYAPLAGPLLREAVRSPPARRRRCGEVWGAERWRVYLAPQPETPAEALRFLVTLPRHDSVALALGYNDLGYPAFGPRFERRVELVPEGSDARATGRDVAPRQRGSVRCDRRNVLASCGRVAGGLGRVPPAGRMPAVTVRRRASPARRPTRRGARRTSRRA